MKKILFILLGLICINLAINASPCKWKEGDIIFQISKSKQSPLIHYATGSLWTHCGIIVFKNNKPFVLEASNVVKLTPIDTWLKRGRGGISITKTVINNPIKINYKKYLGQPYDLAFKFNNNKMYCSELVWTIYKEQFGIELCKPKSISSYNTFGLKKIMKQRGINKNQLFVAPSDLL